MQTNMPNNGTQFRTPPIISYAKYYGGITVHPGRTGSTVLELSFLPIETLVPTCSGLPSHSRQRARLVILSHVAGSYQQAARNALRKTK
jgi:hypothetical protein